MEPPRQVSHEPSLYGFLGSGDCSSHLGQRQLTPELLQVRDYDRTSEGLRVTDKAGVLLFDYPRRREAAGEHATQFATISSENKAAVYEHFFLRGSKKSRFYRTK